MKALPVFTLKPRNVTPLQNKTRKMDEPVRHGPNGPIGPVGPVGSRSRQSPADLDSDWSVLRLKC